ncbi:MAG: hypothetical protein ABIQ11_05670, partial [Saprospiraceae bacterium]
KSPEIISSTPAVTDAGSTQHHQQSNQSGVSEQNSTAQLTENGELADVISAESSKSNSITGNSTNGNNAGVKSNYFNSESSVDNNDLAKLITKESPNANVEGLNNDPTVINQPIGFNELFNTGDEETTNIIASAETRMNESIIPMIDYLDAGELETQSLAIGTVHPGKSSRFKRANNLLTPHLTVGVMKEFQSGLGAHGGAGLDINVSPRLSLTADVGYSIYNPDVVLFGSNSAELQNQGSILKNDLAYEGIGDYLPIEVVNTASGQVISQFVQTVNQWQVSAGIKYDLSRRFFVQAGATYGFGTTSTSKYPIVSNDINNIPTTGNAIRVENSFDTYDVLKNTTSVTAGIGYKISPKTEVYAQWSHGLNQYLEGKGEAPLANDPSADRGSGDNYIRGIDFGMRHSL